MKGFLVLLMVIASMTGVCHRVHGFSDDVLEQIWQNDVAPCEDCTEIAAGWYYRDGTKKPFLLLRKSQNGEEGATAFVYLSFLGGDKYLIQSRFFPKDDKIATSQVALLTGYDAEKPRALSPPLYEDLRETNLSPLFLNLAVYLSTKYSANGISDGESVEAVLKKGISSDADNMLQLILAHKIVVRVEELDGHVAPVQVETYRNGVMISAIRMQNAIANGRLRPFTMTLTSRDKTDNIQIDSWGSIPDNHEYFTRTGLGRGDLSIPEILRKVPCPPEICKK